MIIIMMTIRDGDATKTQKFVTTFNPPPFPFEKYVAIFFFQFYTHKQHKILDWKWPHPPSPSWNSSESSSILVASPVPYHHDDEENHMDDGHAYMVIGHA